MWKATPSKAIECIWSMIYHDRIAVSIENGANFWARWGLCANGNAMIWWMVNDVSIRNDGNILFNEQLWRNDLHPIACRRCKRTGSFMRSFKSKTADFGSNPLGVPKGDPCSSN